MPAIGSMSSRNVATKFIVRTGVIKPPRSTERSSDVADCPDKKGGRLDRSDRPFTRSVHAESTAGLRSVSFRPRLCQPYRAQTKVKIESGVKYVRRNFLCGLQGREPAN